MNGARQAAGRRAAQAADIARAENRVDRTGFADHYRAFRHDHALINCRVPTIALARPRSLCLEVLS